MRVVDIGGGLSGFQFALSRAGAEVINIDPGDEAKGLGWPVDQVTIGRLNRAYRTDVQLINTFLEDARLDSDSVDVVYSISTIEHIPEADLPALGREIHRILRPGGSAVLTIDLFLNLTPFTTRKSNQFGTNINVHTFLEDSALDLAHGERSELYGFEEFEAISILGRLEELELGAYPELVQTAVLRKP